MKNEHGEPNQVNYVLSIAITAFVMCMLAGCGTSRQISGKVTSKEGNKITVDSVYRFTVYDTAGLYIGKFVTFTGTRDRSKINSRKGHR